MTLHSLVNDWRGEKMKRADQLKIPIQIRVDQVQIISMV